ncbi:MAG TPA: hypothetical protein VGM23_10230 [Armatimonadota bacterium]
MKEFIELETARLQTMFNRMNAEGIRITVFNEIGSRLFGDLVDSLRVTRIAPFFDSQGAVTRTDFWLLWKSVGYDEGFQYAHTIKVVKCHVEDPGIEIELSDDQGRRHLLELIEPHQEEEWARDWIRWQQYRKDNRERFEQIDRDLLAEHIRIAEEWH